MVSPLLVSYTMDDLIFVWDEDHPLNIDSSIEMPELRLYNTTNVACVTLYPTGKT